MTDTHGDSGFLNQRNNRILWPSDANTDGCLSCFIPITGAPVWLVEGGRSIASPSKPSCGGMAEPRPSLYPPPGRSVPATPALAVQPDHRYEHRHQKTAASGTKVSLSSPTWGANLQPHRQMGLGGERLTSRPVDLALPVDQVANRPVDRQTWPYQWTKKLRLILALRVLGNTAVVIYFPLVFRLSSGSFHSPVICPLKTIETIF